MDKNLLEKRDPSITLSRTLGMIFIVLCHIIGYYTFIPAHNVLDQFFNCGVQLFLFISGYLYGVKFVGKFKDWYLKRAITVSLPAVLISVIVIIALLIAGESVPTNSAVAYVLDLEGLLFINFGVFSKLFEEIPSIGPLWFTTVIMLCYLLVPLLHLIAKKIKRRFTLFIILFFIVGIAVSVALSKYIVLNYFVLFATGYFLGKINWLNKIKDLSFIICTVIFIVALAGRLLMQKYFDNTSVYIYYSTVSHQIVGTWFVVLFAYLINKFPNAIGKFGNSKAVRILDEYSFYVFLTHSVFCIGAFNLYEQFSLPVATLLFLLCTAAAAVILKFITGLVTKTLNKLIGRNYKRA